MNKLYSILSRYGLPIAFGVGALICIIFFLVVQSSDVSQYTVNELVEEHSSVFNFGIYAAITLVVLSAIIILIATIFQSVIDFKRYRTAFISLGILLFIVLLSRLFVGSEHPVILKMVENPVFNISASNSSWIETLIRASIGLGVIAILSAVALEIYSLFRR